MTADTAASVNQRVRDDRRFMAQALHQARALETRPWPNPPVGAVVVADGQVVGTGAHRGSGTPHAETVALAEAGPAARGGTLYVTLEPCNHTGRTPPCAPAVADAGIRRVVVAMRDPNPRVVGRGCDYLRERGLQVGCGVLAAEALELVWPFAVTDGFARPYLELKTAVSLDGRFAPAPLQRTAGMPVYLTGAPARQEVHRRRRWMDAVLVGEATARADQPRLDCRLADRPEDGPRRGPVPGYLDTDLSWDQGLLSRPFVVLAGERMRGSEAAAALERIGARPVFIPEHDGRIDLAALPSALAEAGLLTVMIEGGPLLASACLAAGIIDRWVQFTAPRVLGAGVGWPVAPATAPAVAAYSLTRHRQLGDDLLAVYDRRDFDTVLQEVAL